MNAQEIFDKAYAGVVKQRKQSDGGTSCVYFKTEKTKCGVGHCLSPKAGKAFDKLASNPLIGDTSISYIVINRASHEASQYVEQWMVDNLELLSEIQAAHDNTWYTKGKDFVEEFGYAMGKVAEKFDLKVPAQ